MWNEGLVSRVLELNYVGDVKLQVDYEILWLHCMCLNLIAYDMECTGCANVRTAWTYSTRINTIVVVLFKIGGHSSFRFQLTEIWQIGHFRPFLPVFDDQKREKWILFPAPPEKVLHTGHWERLVNPKSVFSFQPVRIGLRFGLIGFPTSSIFSRFLPNAAIIWRRLAETGPVSGTGSTWPTLKWSAQKDKKLSLW